MSNKNILLCDLGGTHLRCARLVNNGIYADFKKYILNDYSSLEDIITAYYKEIKLNFSEARFSVARTPINGVIDYKRNAGDPDYIIDFNKIENKFAWSSALYLNDLEAAAHGIKAINESQIQTLFPRVGNIWNDNKIIISVGTGIGHAGIFNKDIQKTAGGHFLPVTATNEHRQLEDYIRSHKDKNLSLIMEDFVSGRGLQMILNFITGTENNPGNLVENLKNSPDTIRLFFEFLGLYAHVCTSVTGFYGGIYLTGGVIDNLVINNLANWPAFEKYFRPNMVSSVNDRLRSTPVYYVLHTELPLLGLSTL